MLSRSERVIVLSEKYVDLRRCGGKTKLFVLKMVEGSMAAGGRGAGFGERKITKAALYSVKEGECEKLFETEGESVLQALEVPYSVSRLPFTLEDGTEVMGYGIVDPGLVDDYARRVE